MAKTTVCTCTEKTSKQQKSRCRSKRQCKFPPQRVGRKPSAKKEDPKVTCSRYDKSYKGKLRNARRRWREWAAEVKAEIDKLPPLPDPLPEKPRECRLIPEEGTWTPALMESPPMAEPLPARKRGQLPKDFWEEVLKRRAEF